MRIADIFGVKPDSFAKYIRSESELLSALRSYDLPKNAEGIIRLFSEHNLIVADNVHISLDTNDLYQYREYDRTPVNGWTGSNTEEEFEELKADIRRNGVKTPIILRMVRQPNGNVKAYLGEGNHRVLIAKMLGIRKIPTSFYYVK